MERSDAPLSSVVSCGILKKTCSRNTVPLTLALPSPAPYFIFALTHSETVSKSLLTRPHVFPINVHWTYAVFGACSRRGK